MGLRSVCRAGARSRAGWADGGGMVPKSPLDDFSGPVLKSKPRLPKPTAPSNNRAQVAISYRKDDPAIPFEQRYVVATLILVAAG